ncbi:hypothetical protein N9W68_00545 [Candidatus Pelagibacter bacterium]|nr:hypothetical protein [Candidatus Pelagibacter bacterium]
MSNNGNQKMNYRSLIEGKKVLLLGPASYLKDKINEIDLNKYDVIVKLNKMVEKPSLPESLNDRNDILYHCIDINIANGDTYDVKTWSEKKVGHLRIPMPAINSYYHNNIERFNRINEIYKIESSIIKPETYLFVKNNSNTSPNTGTVAIYDLLINNPQELRIAGMTFCKTPYIKGYKEQVFYNNKRKSQHDHDKQILFFKKMLKEYKEKIIIDDELLNIIRSY